MTTSLESLTLHELEERYNAMRRYLNEMKEEITRRKANCKEDTEQPEQPEEGSSFFNLFTSMTGKKVDSTSNSPSTSKIAKKKIKVKKPPTKEKTSSKKDETDSTTRKIKATADDMKDALRKNNIKFKASILRDELESLIRTHNLVRVSEKISKERKIKK
jgi:hypothetical protein